MRFLISSNDDYYTTKSRRAEAMVPSNIGYGNDYFEQSPGHVTRMCDGHLTWNLDILLLSVDNMTIYFNLIFKTYLLLRFIEPCQVYSWIMLLWDNILNRSGRILKIQIRFLNI